MVQDETDYFTFTNQQSNQFGDIKNKLARNDMTNSSKWKLPTSDHKAIKIEDISREYSSPRGQGSPRDEEIEVSENEEDKFPIQNDTIMKNKFLMNQSMLSGNGSKSYQPLSSMNSFSFQKKRAGQLTIRNFQIGDEVERSIHNNNVSILTDNSRISHTRLET